MQLHGAARPLSANDITIIAGYLGCEIAAVKAVLEIESRGAGFKAGRPIILNEPHVFYRELEATPRVRAIDMGLAYKTWGAKPYPKTQDERYAWLEKAMQIDEAAALRSCSWGLGQLMGFNYKLCGYTTVQEFVRAMCASEGAQLYAMARFIVSKGLQRKLRAQDWAGFAYGYNGSGYKANAYDTKLASAYAKRPRSERVVPDVPTGGQLALLRTGGAPVSKPEPKPPVKEVGGTIAVGGGAAVAVQQTGVDWWIVAAVFAVAIVAAVVIYKIKKD